MAEEAVSYLASLASCGAGLVVALAAPALVVQKSVLPSAQEP